MQDPGNLDDATALAERVRRKDVHPTELVDAAIAAIEKVNPTLNAVVHTMYEQARAAAKGELPDGPFRGVPFVVKDLDGWLAGEPYTQSCRMSKDFVPAEDSELMARLKRSGVVIVGKTNTPELGLLGVTEPELRGPTRNPWNPDHTPGGSSGGTAAIVAARAVPMGHGGDGGGSIRIPSSACGLFGMKPSRGRNPLGPQLAEGWAGTCNRACSPAACATAPPCWTSPRGPTWARRTRARRRRGRTSRNSPGRRASCASRSPPARSWAARRTRT